MLEIFSYTERVVAMIRPRKLLFMAIGAFHFLSTLALNSFTPLGFCLRSKAETDSLDVLVGCAITRRSCAESQNEPAAVETFPSCAGGRRG